MYFLLFDFILCLFVLILVIGKFFRYVMWLLVGLVVCKVGDVINYLGGEWLLVFVFEDFVFVGF